MAGIQIGIGSEVRLRFETVTEEFITYLIPQPDTVSVRHTIYKAEKEKHPKIYRKLKKIYDSLDKIILKVPFLANKELKLVGL